MTSRDPSVALRVIWPLLAMVCLPAGCGPEQGNHLHRFAGDTDESRGVPDRWPIRAVWVVRETYDSPEEIAELMQSIHEAGLNTVIFQVRGNATAWYRSSIEPFAYEYEDGDPGFDPLEVACTEAHRRGLALHAWVNVMPGWRDHRGQGLPPEDPEQLYNKRPEWFLVDQHGRREPIPPTFYVNVNPCLPEVRAYLVSVMEEIVQNYPVDGLHLDYIRFVMDVTSQKSDYPRDERTLKLYRQATGRTPEDNPAGWAQWKRQQVTQLVSEIRAGVKQIRPSLHFTVAAAPDIHRARDRYFQDAAQWLARRLVDAAFVMNYTRDTEQFRKQHQSWVRAAGGGTIVEGIGVYMHEDPGTTRAQLALAERWDGGFCLFSHNALFTSRGTAHLEAIRPDLLAMKTRAVETQTRLQADRDRAKAHEAGRRESYGVVP